MNTLYVVATPIGNMEDLSPRALRILSEVSLIAAEDTRHTGAMLKRLGISTPLLSNHGFNERARVGKLLDALSQGDVALVSDAGTPAISDPGTILVHSAVEAGFRVIPIPGPSAVTAAVSASGLIDGPFTFMGFLPRATGERRSTLKTLLGTRVPLVFYESGNRIEALAALLSEQAPERKIVVFRELTKMHEEAIRATGTELPGRLAESTLKGEFVIVIGAGAEFEPVDLDALIQQRLISGERASVLARDLALETGLARSEIYDRILQLGKTIQGA